MNYTTLIANKATSGSIRRFVNYSELDAEQIVLEAQALLYQTLRVREMRTEFSDLSLADGDYYKALPTDFLDPIALKDVTNNIDLRLVPEPDLIRSRVYETAVLIDGTPQRYAIFGEKLQFESKYEAAATLKLVGYKTPAVLATTTNETNFLTSRYPHLLRVACVTQAYDFMSNAAKYQSNLTLLSALIEKTNAESDLSYRGAEFEVGVY